MRKIKREWGKGDRRGKWKEEGRGRKGTGGKNGEMGDEGRQKERREEIYERGSEREEERSGVGGERKRGRKQASNLSPWKDASQPTHCSKN